MPETAVDLHRLIWSPDDFDGETLTTSAFPKNDLMGGERYLSVSRTDILDADAELRTASGQAASDSGNVVREEAMSVILNCGDVCNAEDDKGVQPFVVTNEPIPNENEAHCGIRNSTDTRSRGYINQLRAILVRLASQPQKLDDFLSSIQNK
ncbi:hypothetical protein [Algirhabdus cladophorae]|uniref:hypothetical protein n=1 Tax=Algirhabdus cladophorae TaxID=3377108 RepID=UPI003B84943B